MSQPDPCGVVAHRAYLEVHQLELEKLSTQIRESKRNSRLVSVAGKNLPGSNALGQTAGVVGTAGAAHGPPVPRGRPASVGTSGASLGSGAGLHGAPVLLSCTPQPRLGAACPRQRATGGGCAMYWVSLGGQSWLCAASYPSPLSSRAFSTIWIR